jgi:hypothetical protein
MLMESLTAGPELENAIMRRARPYRGENPGPGKDADGELDGRPGIRERPRPKTVKANDEIKLLRFDRNSLGCGSLKEVMQMNSDGSVPQ